MQSLEKARFFAAIRMTAVYFSGAERLQNVKTVKWKSSHSYRGQRGDWQSFLVLLKIKSPRIQDFHPSQFILRSRPATENGSYGERAPESARLVCSEPHVVQP